MKGTSEARRVPSMWLIAGIAAAVVLVLLLAVVWLSLQPPAAPHRAGLLSLDTYRHLFASPSVVQTIVNTFGFSAVTTGVSLLFGVSIAWLVARTDIPFPHAIRTGMTVGILLPGFATAMGWTFFLDPRIGMFNRLLQELSGNHALSLNVATIPGMGWVQGLSLAPVSYIFTVGIFRSLDPSFEEAARTAGAGPRRVLRTITLRMMIPALVAAGIYVFTLGFGIFDVPAVIGLSNRIFTVSTLIYLYVQPLDGIPHYGQAAALGMVAVAFALLFSVLYAWVVRLSFRYQTVSGRGFRPAAIPLGRARGLATAFVGLYFLLAFVLPMVLTLWVALIPYVAPPSVALLHTVSLRNFLHLPLGLLARGTRNSVLLMVLTPTLALLVGGCMAWLVARTRSWLRFVVDATAYLPHAVPESVFAVGAMVLSLFVLRGVVPLYGTVWIILLVYVVIRLSFSTRLVTAALLQVSPELEEASHTAGAPLARTLRWITAPLLAPTFLGVWVWMALLALRDLTAAALLVTSSNLTLPVVIWSLWNGNQQTQAAAISFLLVLALAPLVWVFWRMVGRTGIDRTLV